MILTPTQVKYTKIDMTLESDVFFLLNAYIVLTYFENCISNF